MLNGILTQSLPPALTPGEAGVVRGEGRYAAMLTPKGRMISDLRVLPAGAGEEEAFLLDLPAPALPEVLGHLARMLPPRLARVTDLTGSRASLIVLGPGGPDWLAREALGLRVDAGDVAGLPEHAFLQVGQGDDVLRVVRIGEYLAPAWGVMADRGSVEALRRRGVETGLPALGDAELLALRVEAGRPAWGAELDGSVIPPEAGLEVRAVDHTKGCYIGQEVIVRIRDRGHVNRHLRGLLLGGAPPPDPGTELFAAGGAKSVGRVTSVAHSPRGGQFLGLGWVRREVEVPGRVRVGTPEGPEVEVRALPTGSVGGGLSAAGWAF